MPLNPDLEVRDVNQRYDRMAITVRRSVVNKVNQAILQPAHGKTVDYMYD